MSDDDDFYARFQRRERKKAEALGATTEAPVKETKKHIDLRKKFLLGDLIRFSQFSDDKDVVATVIGHGKLYSILVGWRMGDKIPHSHHWAHWEIPTEPIKFVNDWRMFVRMTWITLPNDDGIILDPRQPTQKEMDDAVDMLNEMRLLHNTPSNMDRYNHILNMKRTILDKAHRIEAEANQTKNEQSAKADVKV